MVRYNSTLPPPSFRENSGGVAVKKRRYAVIVMAAVGKENKIMICMWIAPENVVADVKYRCR